MTRRDPPDDRDTLVDAKKTRLGVGGTKGKADPELVGQVVGGYLVAELLGSGAMGAVYRGSHIDTNRVVALKVLHPHLLDETSVVERFRREARVAARLGHPHIGGVIELVQAADGRYVIVLEYVEGEPLSAIMTMPLPPERVTLLASQLLRGLEHAHASGLVHRDLKPDNVLVEWRNGRDHARIVDFGIAIVREGSEESLERLTATGQMVGTPLYMSPEQARGEFIDHRADLYSLGVMVYEMISGVLPFEGRPLDILAASLKRDPPAIAQRVPGLIVEPLLELFCRKLMARDLTRRFTSARHALDVLKLMETDPEAALPALGVMDVEKALRVVSLPPPPTKR
ncbi:MAG: serine/threonine protein kinase [Myxococcales bacterium]|nr:serine/threonine protein kinase [Myxococcales bacterium]